MLHYIALHYVILHSMTLYFTLLQFIAFLLHYNSLYYVIFHFATLYNIMIHDATNAISHVTYTMFQCIALYYFMSFVLNIPVHMYVHTCIYTHL